MVDATYIDNNRLQVVKNDDIAFDTERPSVTLFPNAYRIEKTDFVVNFPSPIQARAYYRNGVTGVAKCELWSTLIWQEWGPNETYHNEQYFPAAPQNSIPGPTTRNLPREYLGSVPASANHLDIRVRMLRVVAPPPLFGVSPPVVFFAENEWIVLPGGSCPVEFFAPLIRHMDIVRIGNDIYLERYQSTKNSGIPITTNGPGNLPQANISVNQSGWNSYAQVTYGSPGGNTFSDGTPQSQLFPASNSELFSLIDARGTVPDGNNRRPNGSDACAGPYPDLTSTYHADIIIIPGIRK